MMNEEIVEALEAEIKSEFEALKTCEKGSEEQQAVVDNIVKLYRIGLEEGKSCVENDESIHKRELEIRQADEEVALKEKQHKKDWILGCIKLGVEACGIIFPILFYRSWMRKGFEFEKDGTFTSTTFRGLFNKFRPTK